MTTIKFKLDKSIDGKKRSVMIEEIIDKDGVICTTKRRAKYFVINKTPIIKITDADKLMSQNLAGRHNRKRHMFILKIHDDKKGKDSFFCKVAGIFYAYCQKELFCIAFVHSFKIFFTSVVKLEDK